MEVKGTHNEGFKRGAIRQLGGWMDEVLMETGRHHKGIFVGNANRNEDPIKRDGPLVEPESENFARAKDMVILRSLDLFCVVVLKQIGLLNADKFISEFCLCKGSFDCADYHAQMPPEFGAWPPLNARPAVKKGAEKG
jgi:hypothetical protein